MSPIAAAVIVRAIAGAFATSAAAVPSVVNGEPTTPIPATLEEAVTQVVLALVAAGIWYLRKRAEKSKSGADQ